MKIGQLLGLVLLVWGVVFFEIGVYGLVTYLRAVASVPPWAEPYEFIGISQLIFFVFGLPGLLGLAAGFVFLFVPVENRNLAQSIATGDLGRSFAKAGNSVTFPANRSPRPM